MFIMRYATKPRLLSFVQTAFLNSFIAEMALNKNDRIHHRTFLDYIEKLLLSHEQLSRP